MIKINTKAGQTDGENIRLPLITTLSNKEIDAMTVNTLPRKRGRKQVEKTCVICGSSFLTIYPKQETCGYSCSNKKRWGHTSDPGSRLQSVLSNFRVSATGCWEYQGCKTEGYGIALISGKKHLVHRLAYETKHGVVLPDNLLVCHQCDNPSCINPEHLFPGTLQDNMTDAKIKGRKVKKMSAEKIARMLEMVRTGLNYYEVAKEFNISFSTAAAIARQNGIHRKRSHSIMRVLKLSEQIKKLEKV